MKTPRSFIASQSFANGVLFFVGDGAKPLVALFVSPSVVASYSAALRLFEVALIPVKGFLFETLHRWFDGSLHSSIERRQLLTRLLGLAVLSACAFGAALVVFGLLFGQKYPSFIGTWIVLAPLIVVRTVSYAMGDAIVAAGKPLVRVACLALVPLTLMVVVTLVDEKLGLFVALGLLFGEALAAVVLSLSVRTSFPKLPDDRPVS